MLICIFKSHCPSLLWPLRGYSYWWKGEQRDRGRERKREREDSLRSENQKERPLCADEVSRRWQFHSQPIRKERSRVKVPQPVVTHTGWERERERVGSEGWVGRKVGDCWVLFSFVNGFLEACDWQCWRVTSYISPYFSTRQAGLYVWWFLFIEENLIQSRCLWLVHLGSFLTLVCQLNCLSVFSASLSWINGESRNTWKYIYYM